MKCQVLIKQTIIHAEAEGKTGYSYVCDQVASYVEIPSQSDFAKEPGFSYLNTYFKFEFEISNYITRPSDTTIQNWIRDTLISLTEPAPKILLKRKQETETFLSEPLTAVMIDKAIKNHFKNKYHLEIQASIHTLQALIQQNTILVNYEKSQQLICHDIDSCVFMPATIPEPYLSFFGRITTEFLRFEMDCPLNNVQDIPSDLLTNRLNDCLQEACLKVFQPKLNNLKIANTIAQLITTTLKTPVLDIRLAGTSLTTDAPLLTSRL